MEIDWTKKLRPKAPRVQIIETDAKSSLPAPAGGKRKLWEALPNADRKAGTT